MQRNSTFSDLFSASSSVLGFGSFLNAAGVLAVAGAFLPAPVVIAQSIPERLDTGTQVIQRRCVGPCLCAAGPIYGALQGRFQFEPVPSIPEAETWNVIQVHFVGRLGDREVLITGSGIYQILLVTDPRQRMVLDLTVRDGETITSTRFDSGAIPLGTRTFPEVDISITAPVIGCEQYLLDLHTGPTCAADFDDGSGRGVADGGVTIDDLLYYLDLFDQGAVTADLDDGTSTGTPDGGITIDDLLFYLARFDAGC